MSTTASINLSGFTGSSTEEEQQYNVGEFNDIFPNQEEHQGQENKGPPEDQVFYSPVDSKNQIIPDQLNQQGQNYSNQKVQPTQLINEGQIYQNQSGAHGQVHPPQGQVHPSQVEPQGQVYSSQGQVYPSQGGLQGQVYSSQGLVNPPQGQVYSSQGQVYPSQGGPQGQVHPPQGQVYSSQGQVYPSQGGPQGQVHPPEGQVYSSQGQAYPSQGGPQGQGYSNQGQVNPPQSQVHPPQGQVYPSQGGPQGQVYSSQGQVYQTQGGLQGQLYSNQGGPQSQIGSYNQGGFQNQVIPQNQGLPHGQVHVNQANQQSQAFPSQEVSHGQVTSNQAGKHGQVFHISGNQVTHVDDPAKQMIAAGPKLAFSASNYPANVQQQQYQQQFQMQQQQQYQPQQQFQPQTQQFQPVQQQYQSKNPMNEQAQYQQQIQNQQIQMTYVQPQMSIQTKDQKKPPVFEAPISKMHMVKKNQSAPPKSPAQNMQQSFRTSRSGSITELDEITDPPHFLKHPDPHQTVIEGDPICLTARVIPAGDPNLTVQWYKDGQPLSAGSRFNTSFERGFAVLEILYTFKEDSGEYSCVSKNNFGMDQTSPSVLNVEGEDNVVMNSHLPTEMADSIAAMEASLDSQQISNDHYEKPLQHPKFIRPMPAIFNLKEGQSVHMETMFTPINDSVLSIEWYKNGKPLNNGCRFNMISDRGFAILDIVCLIPDDIGDYFCVARNSLGQAQSNVVKLMVAIEASVVTTSQLPKESVQQLELLDSYLLDDLARPDFRYEEAVEEECPPHFDIKPVDVVVEEGSPAKFLVKVSGYPRPRIQWLLNASSGVSTSTQRVYNDGSISYFEFNRCKPIGESNILVIIKNKLGEDTATATLTVMPSNDFRPELKRIDPENPFRKLTTLKKVDVSPELKNAFKKQKPLAVELIKMERESLVRGKQTRSNESSAAENLYNNVQSKLRRSDRVTYSGGTDDYAQGSENAAESYTNIATVPSFQPVMQSTQIL